MTTVARPEVGIILPFTKETTWLREAIESILQQTFQSFELILVSSQASDEALRIASHYATQDQRIRMVESNVPGIAPALNTGLAHTESPFIARMDADDRAHPLRLQKQIHFLNHHPEIAVVSCQTSIHPDTETGEGMRAFMEWQNRIIDPDDHFRNRFVESPIAHPTVVFRRELISLYGEYSNNGIPEDYELWLRWMSMGVHIHKLNEPLIEWRDHPERLSRTGTDYARDKFFRLKVHYLVPHLKSILHNRRLILCGAGRQIRKQALELEQAGIPIGGFTDVIARNTDNKTFIPAQQIHPTDGNYYLSLVSSRGKSEELRTFLSGKGLNELEDFTLAAG
jgi:glycosyltransferase involved in cell wall biosynthesis